MSGKAKGGQKSKSNSSSPSPAKSVSDGNDTIDSNSNAACDNPSAGGSPGEKKAGDNVQANIGHRSGTLSLVDYHLSMTMHILQVQLSQLQ